MRRHLIITSIFLIIMFSVKSQENKNIKIDVIDINRGLNNLSRLMISDFGKTIRFIPLETHNDGLIGRNPVVKVLRDYIVVEYYPRPSIDPGVCLLFSKKDGSFISKIGHIGQDPSGYSKSFSWADENEDFLYFQRMPNQLIKYDMQGNFCGSIKFSSTGLASYYLITNTEIIGYFDELDRLIQYSNQNSLCIFEKDGKLKNSVRSFFPSTTPFTDDLFQTNIMNGKSLYNMYGSWTRAGAFIFDYTPARQIRQINPLHAARIWRNGENIRFKQDFVDTIYTVSGNNLMPFIAFNTEKFHWPAHERRSEKNNNGRIFIADIYENNNFIFFQCVRGMYLREPVLYNGLYNKKTKSTKICKNSDSIEDDLMHFVSFKPLGISTSGEFVSIIEIWEIIEWLEKHPESLNNDNLSFLRNLKEDDNPIVILIE